MNVLITGGAGFIGSHLVDYYLARGHRVYAIDNLLTGRVKNIEHHLSNRRFRFIESDVCRTRFGAKIDLVLHFASPASPFDYLKFPIETLKTASFGTHNMLELARKNRARFLLASTSEVYGDPLVHPQREDYWGNVNPAGPRAVYDEGKRFAEAMTTAYRGKFGVATRIVRIFNTYGERMRSGDGRVIPAFIAASLRQRPLEIFGSGRQTRSFCYIRDMVAGIARLARTDYALPVNIGNPDEYSVLELARIIKNLTGSRSKFVFRPLPQDDPRKRKPDISRARKILHWQPEYGLRDGLTRLVGWFRRDIEGGG